MISFNKRAGPPYGEELGAGFYFDPDENIMYFKKSDESIMMFKGREWFPYWRVTIIPQTYGDRELPEGYVTTVTNVDKGTSMQALTFPENEYWYISSCNIPQPDGSITPLPGFPYTPSDDCTIYVTFSPKYAHLELYSNYGSYGSGYPDSYITAYYEDNKTLPAFNDKCYERVQLYLSLPEGSENQGLYQSDRVYFPQDHWNTNKDDSGTSFDVGAAITLDAFPHTSYSYKLYAQYKTTAQYVLPIVDAADGIPFHSCVGWCYRDGTLIGKPEDTIDISMTFGGSDYYSHNFYAIMKPDTAKILEYVTSTPLENATWAMINIVSEAYQSGDDDLKQAIRTAWPIGSKNKIYRDWNAYDQDKPTYVVLLGYNHDYQDDVSNTPVTFTFGLSSTDLDNNPTDEYITQQHTMNYSITNETSWKDSDVRYYLNESILTYLQYERDQDIETGYYGETTKYLKNIIKPVLKHTAQSGENGTLVATTDKLFLFSATELYGGSTRAYEEGTEYEAKLESVGASGSRRIWLRSPAKATTAEGYTSGTNQFCCIVAGRGANDLTYGQNNGISSMDANNELYLLYGFCV